MNKFTAIHVFCLVCQHQSFAQAAKALTMSPAMVGRYIKQLEQELGTLLVKRTTRHLSITEAGQAYYQQVSGILTQLETAEQQIAGFGTKPQGKLRVSSSIEFGGQYLAPIIVRYRQLYPEVALSFNLTNEPVDITQRQEDLVFRVAPKLADASLKTVPIASSKLALWASSEYLHQHPGITTVDDLNQHQLLFFEHSLRTDQWLFSVNGAIEQRTLPWTWKTNNGRLLNEAASLHQGIIQAPSYSVASYVEAGLLQEVLPQFSINTLAISAIYQHSAQYSLPIKTFIEVAKQHFIDYPLA